MHKINDIKAREILDSRGNPTVEVDIILDNNICARASVPSGASTGTLEAYELRDKDMKRYLGKGVQKAIANIENIIKPELIGKQVTEQTKIDQLLIDLDGTKNKHKLGANAILAVSLAACKATAKSKNRTLYQHIGDLFSTSPYLLPTPMMNIINGGTHANNKLDIQEFMIVPTKAKNIKEAIRMGAEIFQHLKILLAKKGYSTSVGDEGGFAPDFQSTKQALDFITEAVQKANYQLGTDICYALDVAASELYDDNSKIYNFSGEDLKMNGNDLVHFYSELVENYPIISIEDPMAENDYSSWQNLTANMGNKIQLVGDDVFVTNPAILQDGINQKIANSILIKVNQIGTLTETLKTIKIAQQANYSSVISHRSGETEDTTIAHIAVATNCGQIKTGSLSRTDRLAKYNELIRIEEELSENAKYSDFLYKKYVRNM